MQIVKQLSLALALGNGVAALSAAGSDFEAAIQSINKEHFARHVRTLASDDFEGRAPGTIGEQKSVAYIENEFRKLSLLPGHPDGTYIQDVPLTGTTAQQPVSTYRAAGRTLSPAFPGESVIWTKRAVPAVQVADSEVVFVGYGVVAPEYGWDDYKGVDVRGKTILMLINDPPIPDPAHPGQLDDKMFKGRAMTYYGRWTYKYEIAAEKGAAAAIIVHETGPAGYPFFVIVGSNSRENFDLRSENKNMDRAAVEGWMTLDKAKELTRMAGHEFTTLKTAALRKDFRPVPLGIRANFAITNVLRDIASRNVIAKLEGSDPGLKNEYLIYTAHWDHLGKNPNLKGDPIYNGAVDNATGVASLLELARAFAALPTKPKRSILFLSVTAEEKGLLGAKYYATHPLYPLSKTVANLNMDAMTPWGRTRDVNIIGIGNTTLEDLLEAAAKEQGRVITPDAEPEKGRYFRSDHFEFAKVGVPALYGKSGEDYLGKPSGYGKTRSDAYIENDYHKVSDEMRPDWDLSGAVEDTQLLFAVGWQVATRMEFPAWKPGSEFRTRREEMLRGKRSSQP